MGGFTYNREEGLHTLSDSWSSETRGSTWVNESAWHPIHRCEMAMDVIINPTTNASSLIVTGGIDFVTFESYNDAWISTDGGVTFTQQTANASWAGRHGHGLVTVDHSTNTIALLAGYAIIDGHADFYNDVWTSSDLGKTWVVATANAPWARRGDAAITANSAGNIFIAGGYGETPGAAEPDSLLNDVWMSSTDWKTWTPMTAAAQWWPRWGSALKYVNTTLVLLGGDDGGQNLQSDDGAQENCVSDVWVSWNNGKDWTLTASAQWAGRKDFLTEVIVNELYVAGGMVDLSPWVVNDIWYAPLELNAPPEAPSKPQKSPEPYSEWTKLATASVFSRRASAVSAYFPPWSGHPNGRWLVVGGYTNSLPAGYDTLSDSWSSEDQGTTWWPVNDFHAFKRCEMAMDVIVDPQTAQSTLIVTGGIDFVTFESFGDVWSSTDGGETFTPVIATAPWHARHGHGLVTVDHSTNTIALLAGYAIIDGHADFYNDVWTSSDLGKTWVVATTNAPWAKRGDAAITANSAGNIFIAGGYGPSYNSSEPDSLLNDVWMSSTDWKTWTQMTAAAEWWPRWGAALEHFNNTLVLLGGDDGGDQLQADGSHSHPVSEVWVSWNNGTSWTLTANAQWSGRKDFLTEVIDGQLYVGGGEDNALLPVSAHQTNDIWYAPVEWNSNPRQPSKPEDKPVDPTPKPAPTPSPSPEEHKTNKGLSTGAVVGIVVGVLAVLGVIGLLMFLHKTPKPRAPADGGYHLQE